MLHSGDRLENPVTGEVLVFDRTSEETNGERGGAQNEPG
jgi:hypothetical protein